MARDGGDISLEGLAGAVRGCLARAGVCRVVAGVSGGADSVAMLSALLRVGIEVVPVHCNFGLRGPESDSDEKFVRDLCSHLGLKLHCVHFNTREYMQAAKVSVEVACRELRYAEFRRILQEEDAERIAVAHNSDDQAETVLLNLMRGAGVSGMRGMLEDTGEIIRPLLSVSRREILQYLEAASLQYVTDSTNLSCDYRRNFLRNKVLPLLRTEWPEASRAINRTAANMADEEKILNDIASKYFTHTDSLTYHALQSTRFPAWLIGRFGRRLGASDQQIESMCAVWMRSQSPAGRTWHVKDGKIESTRSAFIFVSDTARLCEDKFEVEMTIVSTDSSEKDMFRECGNDVFFTTLPPSELLFRHPCDGDKIAPLGMKGSARVSKILKDAGIPASQRKHRVVACHRDTGEVLWLEGLKRSAAFLVPEDAQQAYSYKIIR